MCRPQLVEQGPLLHWLPTNPPLSKLLCRDFILSGLNPPELEVLPVTKPEGEEAGGEGKESAVEEKDAAVALVEDAMEAE